MKVERAIVLCLVSSVLAAGAGELDVAKAALRDGLWKIARAHATNTVDRESRLIILESYAGENRWDAIGKALNEWKVSQDPAFDYYRAALAGDYAKAVELLRKSSCPGGAVEAKMLEADLQVKANNREAARKLWSEVVALSNASERAQAVAAANLGIVEPLRKAYLKVRSPELRRITGIRLGMALLNATNTVVEGSKLIRAIVKDAPDVKGAQEAFVALAETELAASRWQEAVDAYHEAMETWPDVSKLAKVQDGRGWGLLKLGRHSEALDAFERAEKLATDDESRAKSALKQGDVLAEMGKVDESMARYHQVLDKYPKTHVAEKLKNVVRVRELEAKGRELYRGYRFEEASKAFAEVAASDASRKSRMAYFEVLCLYGRGRDDVALENAIRLANSCPDAHVRADASLWIAKLLFNRGEWQESGRRFSDFAALEPDSPHAPDAMVWSARAAFSQNDFNGAIQRVTRLAEKYPNSASKPQALLIQGEALIELARFDEAVLVLDGVSVSENARAEDRMRAQMLKADAFFAMGADNPVRYETALDAYRAVRFGGTLSVGDQLSVSFKIARTLEKLKRMDEALDQYYTQVVLAYWEGHRRGERFGDEAKVAFSRAAFRLADEYESRGKDMQAQNVLKLVSESDVPAAEEAKRRMERFAKKGRFL